MNMKHIIILASCLIVAMPTQNLSYAQQPAEPMPAGITKQQASTAAVFIGIGIACIVGISSSQIPHLSSFSKAVLSNNGLVPGMVGGAVGLASGQVVYNLLYGKKPESGPDMHAEFSINITK